ncbi:hypothetical protein OAM47_04035 [Gammaproteobacteria bacterium]|nr:hypothetical protein [Gammaproteobacteria bacterium]
MNSPTIRDKIIGNPLYFPFKLFLDRRIGYIKISENTFKQSSFLDNRIVGSDRQLIFLDALDFDIQLKKLTIQKQTDLIHIFHISHVGSTFVSKLLESTSEIKVLREPNILRNFIREYSNLSNFSTEYKKYELDSMLCGVIKSFLCGKESKVLIKHSSHNLNLPLRNMHIENINQKEILLFTSLKNFLSHSITSEGMRSDVAQSSSFRLDQFNKICYSNFFKLDDLDYLQVVSIIWMLELAKILARKQSNKNALLINFDDGFTDNNKEETINNIVKFTLDNDFQNFQSIINSSDWFINPKNGREYSFKTRADIIKSNKLSASTEIKRVSSWVENISNEEPFFLPLLKFIH